ncbi:MAG TPA: RagB/SusD family nutrient uptake outer membrane protein [Chitinophagaceae bacterium]|nr:RagB/SusD family nutrient uptake outer membrane protein [Chitinophagaceae bacterium]
MKKYIGILLLSTAMIACKKDFLEEKTKGLIRPDNYFTTLQDLEKTLNALYSNGNLMYNQTATFSFAMGGDDVTTLAGGNKSGYLQFDVFNVQDNNDRYGNMYNAAYGTIKQANAIIGKVELVTEPANDATLLKNQKDRALGQAHFMRALAYYNLIRMCGEVPLVTELSISYDLKKSPASEVYALIVNDLTKAESLLPVSFTSAANASDLEKSTWYARPSSGAAKSLLASVYLTMAGYPLKDESKYALAAQKAKEVIDNEATYGYMLLPNYADLWKAANNINKETVFGAHYNNAVGDWSDGGTWANGNMNAPMAYKPGDFGGWDDLFAEITFFNEFPEGPRKDATFLTEGRANPTAPLITWQNFSAKHPYYKKWLDVPGFKENSLGDYIDWWSSRTAHVIRYAEVLLIYAEAKAMSGGPDDLAYTSINRVRRRAELVDLPSSLSAAAFRDAVLTERKWEFAGLEPNARWFDMVRTETVESATAKRHPSEIPLVNQPTKQHYFAPIPQADRRLNPNL